MPHGYKDSIFLFNSQIFSRNFHLIYIYYRYRCLREAWCGGLRSHLLPTGRKNRCTYTCPYADIRPLVLTDNELYKFDDLETLDMKAPAAMKGMHFVIESSCLDGEESKYKSIFIQYYYKIFLFFSFFGKNDYLCSRFSTTYTVFNRLI